jgi:hypothetical protein
MSMFPDNGDKTTIADIRKRDEIMYGESFEHEERIMRDKMRAKKAAAFRRDKENWKYGPVMTPMMLALIAGILGCIVAIVSLLAFVYLKSM